ncbi:hypothetical protein E2562_013100 [Oryza meyeriana var. granulata]|uniref:Uncharacterized protein n=1 Tax=Oryza meyeriana var. granulata TaxID=110450 RepID=A0A6G1F7N2_9ORYZ|nr:hypothetical protein E2562_013100 [Oryza meyeriana var. granulata]
MPMTTNREEGKRMKAPVGLWLTRGGGNLGRESSSRDGERATQRIGSGGEGAVLGWLQQGGGALPRGARWAAGGGSGARREAGRQQRQATAGWRGGAGSSISPRTSWEDGENGGEKWRQRQ